MVATFCFRLNRCCYQCSIAIPLGAVYTLITWAWVVFSGSICIYSIGGSSGYLLGFISSMLYILVFWSYTSACFTDPGSPSTQGETSDRSYSTLPQHRADGPSFTSVTVKDDGSERFCQKCTYKKPDRTHHCRSCKKCILKMDHHCPWLATCVGLHNYKQFILFLIYVSFWCTFMCICSTFFLWDFFTVNNPEEIEAQFWPINWVVLVVLSGVVGLVVGLFSAWHISLVLRNYTTIEYMEETRFKGDQRRYLTAQSPKDKFNIFDLGYMQNWRQVMGESVSFWFLPIQAKAHGDGFSFEISDRARARLREQQNLHSFERDQFTQRRFDHQYEMNDFRDSEEYERSR